MAAARACRCRHRNTGPSGPEFSAVRVRKFDHRAPALRGRNNQLSSALMFAVSPVVNFGRRQLHRLLEESMRDGRRHSLHLHVLTLFPFPPPCTVLVDSRAFATGRTTRRRLRTPRALRPPVPTAASLLLRSYRVAGLPFPQLIVSHSA